MPRVRYSHPDQLPLDLGLAPESDDAVFFAATPDEEAASKISFLANRLRAKHQLRGRVRPSSVLHVSLRGLGGFDLQSIACVKEVAATIKIRSFKVYFDRALSFRSGVKKPFVLAGDVEGVDGFLELRKSLDCAMTAAGFSGVRAQFTPHVTMLYDSRIIEPEFIDTISWTVRDFHLIHSVVGETRYVKLGAWPLHG